MKLKALIADDEPPARKRLRAMLQSEPDIEVAGEAEDGSSTILAIERLRPDVLFLDVQMPGMDGFEIIDALGADHCPAVVFVTAHDRYALRAFDAHAIDYLLKPYDRQRLHQAVARVQRLAGSEELRRQMASLIADTRKDRPPERLMVRASGRIYFVDIAEIEWIGAAGHYVEVHAAGRAHLIRDTMARIEARLDPARFARIHRGTIVNIARIAEMVPAFHGEYDVVMQGGRRLRASRTYASALQTRLS